MGIGPTYSVDTQVNDLEEIRILRFGRRVPFGDS